MKTQRRGGRGVRPRNDTGQLRWTEQDIQVQCWIGEQYAMRLIDLPSMHRGVTLGPSTREHPPRP